MMFSIMANAPEKIERTELIKEVKTLKIEPMRSVKDETTDGMALDKSDQQAISATKE